jgi:hypothetical protein
MFVVHDPNFPQIHSQPLALMKYGPFFFDSSKLFPTLFNEGQSSINLP